jgi:ECF sigma factor
VGRPRSDALVPIVYDESHRLAHHDMRTERAGHSLQTTVLVTGPDP